MPQIPASFGSLRVQAPSPFLPWEVKYYCLQNLVLPNLLKAMTIPRSLRTQD